MIIVFNYLNASVGEKHPFKLKRKTWVVSLRKTVLDFLLIMLNY